MQTQDDIRANFESGSPHARDDAKVLAAAMRGHAWLARLRAATYGNRWHEMSPDAAHQIAGHVDRLIDAVLPGATNG